mgnify:CR=1 FL=1
MSLNAWIGAPGRRLLVIFFATTSALVVALAWMSWQLVRQDSALAGQRIGPLGLGVLAAEAMQLALLVECVARFGILRSRQVLGGPARLLRGLPPRATELHDLRSVDEARAGENQELRLLLAPWF